MSSTATQPIRKQRWTRFLVSLGVLILCGMIAVMAAAGYWWLEAKWRVDEELEKVRQAREPITAQELEAFYQLPDGAADTTALWENAANMLEDDAFQSSSADLPPFAPQSSQADLPLPNQPWPEHSTAAALLDEFEPALRLMHRAAEQGGAARYELDATSGLNDQQNGLRKAARLLTLEAYVRAHENNTAASVAALLTLLRLSESLRNEPSLISQLTRVGMVRMALEAMQRLIPATNFSATQLTELQDQLRQADYDDGLYRGLLGDRVFGMIVFDDPSVLVDEDVQEEDFNALPTRNHDRRFYLQSMRKFISASLSPDPERLAHVEQLDHEIETVMRQRLSRFQYIVSSLLIAGSPSLFESTARVNFSRDATDAGMAVELYRRQHGSFPTKLTELVPEFLPRIPVDPYDGQPIRYRAANGKQTFYCLGPNRLDDGGIDKKAYIQKLGRVDLLDIVVEFDFEPALSQPQSSTESP